MAVINNGKKQAEPAEHIREDPKISRELTQVFRNNKIRVDFTKNEIEIESFSEPLDRVYEIFNDIAMRLGEVDKKDIPKRMGKVGIN